MIKAIAIDDEPPALKVIESFCSAQDIIVLEKAFTRIDEARKYLSRYPVDLLFLDIHMPALSGIEFYKTLQQQSMVIFTTAYSEFAVEGFNLNAVDYLLKPFTQERFTQAVQKASDYAQYLRQAGNQAQEYLFIRADYSLIKVPFTDILYIEGLDDYLRIHLQSRKPLVARMTMKALLAKLPAHDFIRVHRSYIIPVSGIRLVRNKVISIAGIDIPIGSSYEESFFAKFRPD
jgi:DNA-binding LytR/AlgR family response regulator